MNNIGAVLGILLIIFICSLFGTALFILICYILKIGIFTKEDLKKSIVEMLHEIEEKKCIYNIHYCNAGVGFNFYDGPSSIIEAGENWREYLSTDKYYPTFEEAVKGEWDRIKQGDKDVSKI